MSILVILLQYDVLALCINNSRPDELLANYKYQYNPYPERNYENMLTPFENNSNGLLLINRGFVMKDYFQLTLFSLYTPNGTMLINNRYL